MEPAISGKSLLQRRRLLGVALLIVAAVPMLIPLILIANYGVNVPYWDQWDPDIADIFIKSHDHTLRLTDLAAQHFENRILVPRLIFLMLGKVTSWNTIVEMLVGWLIACATSIVIGILIAQTRLRTSLAASADALQSEILARELAGPVQWLLCNLLIFSPSQWENWLWGFGIIHLLPMFFIATMILIINTGCAGWLKTIPVILLSLGASYSARIGLLAWPIAILMLACSGPIAELKQRVVQVGVVAVAMLVTIGLYFTSYRSILQSSDAGAGARFIGFIHYMMVFAGNSFVHVTTAKEDVVGITTLCGAIAILLFIAACGYLLFRALHPRARTLACAALPWVMIGAFSLISGLVAASSNAQLGLEQAVASRYVTFALYLIVSLVMLVPLVSAELGVHAALSHVASRWIVWAPSIVFGGWLMIAALLSVPTWISTCELQNLSRLRGKAAVLLSGILPDNPHLAAVMHPNAKLVVEQAKRINELGYLDPPLIRSDNANEIAASQAQTQQVVRGAREFYGTLDKEGDLIGVRGFALFPYKHSPADTVFLTATLPFGRTRIFTIAQTTIQRPEKVEEYGDARYALSGWLATFVSGRLPDGDTLLVEAWALDTSTGRAYKLDGSFTVTRGGPEPTTNGATATMPTTTTTQP